VCLFAVWCVMVCVLSDSVLGDCSLGVSDFRTLGRSDTFNMALCFSLYTPSKTLYYPVFALLCYLKNIYTSL
jgi:hypothetical protein